MAVRFSEDQIVAATAAKRLHAGSQVSYVGVCTDTRALTRGCLFVALRGERFDAHQFLLDAVKGGAAGVLVERGVPLPDLPADFGRLEVESTLRALGALAAFHRRRFDLPVAAVTGSNGKTTTKEMIAAILETRGPVLRTHGNLNNEVGVPLTLFRLEPTHVAAVIEMGMNRAGEIARLTAIALPSAGLITVVQPAHLEGLGSLSGVASAKGELFRGLSQSATAIVNADDPLIVAQAQEIWARKITFGRTSNVQVHLTDVTSIGREGLRVTVEYEERAHTFRLKFIGAHNAENAAAAFAVGVALGYSPSDCVRGLSAVEPYAGRLNVLGPFDGVWVIDDSYNANPASMSAALDTVSSLASSGRAVAVLGDMLELGSAEEAEHVRLGQLAAERVKLAAFFGPRSAGACRASAMGDRAAHFTEIEPLVQWVRPQLKPGDVVLVKASRGMKLERVVSSLTGQRPQAH